MESSPISGQDNNPWDDIEDEFGSGSESGSETDYDSESEYDSEAEYELELLSQENQYLNLDLSVPVAFFSCRSEYNSLKRKREDDPEPPSGCATSLFSSSTSKRVKVGDTSILLQDV